MISHSSITHARAISKRSRKLKAIGVFVLVVLMCAVLLYLFAARAYYVPSGSMRPTVMPGEYVMAIRYRGVAASSHPDARCAELRNSVVFFQRTRVSPPRQVYLKRCIAVSGDTLTITPLAVIVNRDTIRFLDTKHPLSGMSVPFGPARISQKQDSIECFMLGDNFYESSDSRHWGCISAQSIIGEAVLIAWSWSPDIPLTDFWNKLRSIRWERIGKIIE